MSLPRISIEDCKNGTGLVEKISCQEFFHRPPPKLQLQKEDPSPKEKIIKFGKYRGRLLKDIEIEDPDYVRWARENTPNFGK